MSQLRLVRRDAQRTNPGCRRYPRSVALVLWNLNRSGSLNPFRYAIEIHNARLRGLTIIELMIVLAVIVIILALLLPAVQSARERAREAVCQNNLRQIHFCLSQYLEANKKLPPRPVQGEVGGWMIEILPFLEQQNLKNKVSMGMRISDAAEFHQPPPLYICPVRQGMQEVSQGMGQAHYVIVTDGFRKYASVYDAPVNLRLPWASSPELDASEMRGATGPHHRGFYYIHTDSHGVESTFTK